MKARTLKCVVASAASVLLAIVGSTAHAQDDAADLGLTAGQVTVSTVNPSVVATSWFVQNNGPATASNVVVVITLPAGTTLTSAFFQAGVPCTYDAQSRQVTCAIGSLDSGISTSAVVTMANTGQPAGTVLTVPAQVTSSTPDPVASNNSASASITVPGGPLPTVPDGPSANLGLAASAMPILPPAGLPPVASLLWDLFNAGPDAAEGVTVVFTLPAGVTYVSAGVAAQTPPCPFDAVTREVICALPGSFASGAVTSAGVQFSLDDVAAGAPVTVVATVRAATLDPDLTDNVRSNTFGSEPIPAPTGPPTTGTIVATGASSSAIAIIATLVLVAGLAVYGASRRTRF